MYLCNQTHFFMKRFTCIALILLSMFSCGNEDDTNCLEECGENIDGGELLIDANSNFAFGYLGGVEVIYKNADGEELRFANAGFEEEPTELSYLNCANSCGTSTTSFVSNVKTLSRRSGDNLFTYEVRVGLLGEAIGEEPFVYDFVDVVGNEIFLRVFLRNRGDKEVDESRVNIISSFNEQLELNGRNFDDVYSTTEETVELHYNFFHGIVAFRTGVNDPLWVFDRVE